MILLFISLSWGCRDGQQALQTAEEAQGQAPASDGRDTAVGGRQGGASEQGRNSEGGRAWRIYAAAVDDEILRDYDCEGVRGMISLETAKALKDAGVKWEPQKGDWAYNLSGILLLMSYGCDECCLYSSQKAMFNDWKNASEQDNIAWFAPSLFQLLAEIEARGYRWSLTHKSQGYTIEVWESLKIVKDMSWVTSADSTEKATAQALLWILQEARP